MPEIQGHRGARALRPENTLPGLAYALDIGVDAIEFDVTLTADGELILAHDLTVDPQTIMSNEPDIFGRSWRSLALADIAPLDAGQRDPVAPYRDTFVPVPGTPVPTLDQVCALIAGLGPPAVTLAVELKTAPSWPAEDVTYIAQRALRTLASYNLTGQTRILAFDWRVLRTVADAVPRVALVERSTWVPGSPWLAGLDPADYQAPDPARCGQAAHDVGASWISPDDRMTSAELIGTSHDAETRVAVWTVNDMKRAGELLTMGADAIITDRPDALRRVFANHGYALPAGTGESYRGMLAALLQNVVVQRERLGALLIGAGLAACGLAAVAGLAAGATPDLGQAQLMAATAPYATSTAVALTITGVGPLGITGYSGVWGTASTGPAGGRDQSDFSDPDNMQQYVSVATKNSQTSGVTAPVVYDARTDLNTLFAGPSLVTGGPKLISLSTLQNYARCNPPHAVQATSYIVAATALGRPLSDDGTPLTVKVTGSDLGLPKVKSGTVTFTLTKVIEKNSPNGAAARTVLTVTGDLDGTDGSTYSGPLATMVLGDVRVNCAENTSPTPTPTTSPTASPTPSESPTPSASPSMSSDEPTSPPPPTSTVNTATPTPTASPTATSTGSPAPTPHPTPVPTPTRSGPPSPPGGLPVTGADLATLTASGLMLIAAGLIVRRTSARI